MEDEVYREINDLYKHIDIITESLQEKIDELAKRVENLEKENAKHE